jgi:hypothetical protein
MQLKNRWWIESSPDLHKGQTVISVDENTEFNLSLVGSIFQAIFQIKNLDLSLRFNFHILFQKLEEVPGKGKLTCRLLLIT